MKRLTELVHLREKLTQAYELSPIMDEVNHLIDKLSSVIDETVLDDQRPDLEALVNNFTYFTSASTRNSDMFQSIITKINQEILVEGTKFFSDNYSLELRVEAEAVSNIRKVRVLDLSERVHNEILNRIQVHSTWKYPATEIGCRDGEWTKFLVASDPLYIVDSYREFLDNTVQTFPETYQRRIRPYLIKDHDMSALPQGQMGLIFCWNYLNYRSLDTVKEYLKSVKELLRPGGTFMFSYNNGDIPECAGYAESIWMSYIPKSMLVPMCESLGYEVTYSRDIRGEGTAISWLELKKPGELSTIRAHQVLGEIKLIKH